MKQPWEHKVWVEERVSELRREVSRDEPGFFREARLRYLNEEIPRLKKSVLDFKLKMGREAVRWACDAARTGDFPRFEDPEKRHLEDLEKERQMLTTNPSDGLDQEKVNRARKYPLYRLLYKRPKQKVPCPFHNDKKPSLYLYSEHGYCFVCSKRVDSISWLMNSGMTFRQAVEKLA